VCCFRETYVRVPHGGNGGSPFFEGKSHGYGVERWGKQNKLGSQKGYVVQNTMNPGITGTGWALGGGYLRRKLVFWGVGT